MTISPEAVKPDSLLRYSSCMKFLILILLVFAHNIFSQIVDYKVEYITPQDGLAHGCVQDIIQDSKGFMWFATEGGLNRYDGYNIKLYDCGEKFIRTVFEDPDDDGKTLWIGSRDGGLFKFDRDSETFLQFKHNPNDSNSISSNNVMCICKCKDGDLWVGTDGGGLNKFNRITQKFEHYRNNPNDYSTLISDQVLSLCEDHKGFLWIGTYGSGLDRLNPESKTFTHFKYDPNNIHTLLTIEIWSLFEDHNNVIWVGGGRGLFKYNREQNLFVRNKFDNPEADILNYRMVTSIMEDNNQTLWIAAQDCGVVSVSKDRSKVKYYKYNPETENTLNTSIIFSACPDHSGNIWVGTTCSGVNKIVAGSKAFHYFHTLPTIPKNYNIEWVYSLFEDKDSVLWIGTGGGLFRFKDNVFKHFQFDDWFYDNIGKIRQFKSDELWIAHGRALTELDPKTGKFTNYFNKYQMYSLKLYNEIDRLDKKSTEKYTLRKVANNSNLVEEFKLEKDTELLILCFGEGTMAEFFDYGWILNKDNNQIVWKLKIDNSRYAGGSPYNRLSVSIIKLPRGNYQLHYKSDKRHSYNDWIGEPPIKHEWWGISVIPVSSALARELKAQSEIVDYTKLHWLDIFDLEEDETGKLWANLTQSRVPIHLFDIKQKVFIPYLLTINDTIYKFHSFFKDRSENLWFRTYNNVLIKRDEIGEFKVMLELKNIIRDTPAPLQSSAIGVIYVDYKNNFWIATDYGLIKYNFVDKKYTNFKEADLLSSGRIQAITEDDNENLWISTNTHVFKFNPEKRSIKKYGKYDGIPDINYAYYCCVKRKNGQLVFGGSNGFIIFHPDSIQENKLPPRIVLTDFQIFNKSVMPGKNSPLEKSISESGIIYLNYNQDVFSIEFAALDFTSPKNNKYAYKMEGVDPDWVYTDASKRFATYTKLEPGNYIFRVKGCNNDGVWNEEGTSLSIIVLPPWWATWWFRTVLLLTFLGIGYSIYRYRINKVLEVERLRVQIASDLHDDIGSALTRIAVHSEIIGTTAEQTKVLKSSKQIGSMSREIITTLSDVVWSIDSRNDTVGDLIDRMRDFLETVFPAGSNHIDFQTKGLHFDQKLEQALRQNIYLIFKEAINNAAKHSGADEIKISLINGSGKFKMEITDNGKGMDEEEKHKGHHGIENMKLRAERIGGELIINHLEKGTSVILIAKNI
jgi:ligand-binding sensor domain-containing protein/two-component sensor histidine kinase